MWKNNRSNGAKPKIAIVGSGVVGTATGTGFSDNGFDVTFIDISRERVAALRLQGSKAFVTEEVNPASIDIFFISVPSYTETYEHGLRHIKESAENLGKWIGMKQDYTLVVLRSTVVPGTTEKLVVPILERHSGKKAGVDFDVCVNPEYLREKSAVSDFKNPWLVVIGADNNKAADLLEKIYYWANCPIQRVTTKEAEMQKFVHNLCNANKISFFNEMRYVCDQLGLNSDKIFSLVSQSAESIWNHAYGTANLGAFDGTCLPKDTKALLQFARESLDIELKLLKAVIDVNDETDARTKHQKLRQFVPVK